MGPQKIVYSFLIADLFTYGHVRMLELAKSNGDYHVCGVITDRVARRWTAPLMGTFDERLNVIKSLKLVDEVVTQDSMDPTENLRALHQRFPDAHLSLMQSHHLWNSTLGADYVKEIGGSLIQNEFYQGLSRDAIKKTFFDYFTKEGTSSSKEEFNDILPFSTKANTLELLRPRLTKSMIEPSLIVTVDESLQHPDDVIDRIQRNFPNLLVVVRSSSLQEDSKHSSNAGKFHSVLDVPTSDRQALSNAIGEVIRSYAKAETDRDDQLLIQRQTADVALSGVLFTRNLWTNTPYYSISFDDETGSTESVTSGRAGKRLEILRDTSPEQLPEQWRSLIHAVREIEQLFAGICLDIEFAIKRSGEVVIFQVRPLAANARFNTSGDEIISLTVQQQQALFAEQRQLHRNSQDREVTDYYLSDMAFWNPAELIGDRPAALDVSLFDHVLMKRNWNEALRDCGYTPVDRGLMTIVAGKPYIVLNHAFKSLLPASISEDLRGKLINFYNAKIKRHPELHDKVEFSLVHNCMTFDFERRAQELRESGFSIGEITELRDALVAQTNQILASFDATVAADSLDLERLEAQRLALVSSFSSKETLTEQLDIVAALVEDCRTWGTTQFSRMARMAFIGSSFLRSLVSSNLVNSGAVDLFLNSISTVATELEVDLLRVRRGELHASRFFETYGHLRPGTYDITQLPYAASPEYFDFSPAPSISSTHKPSIEVEQQNHGELACVLDQACRQTGIKCSGAQLLNFIRTSIELREKFKFIFTKNLSAALEFLATIGERHHISRSDLAMLDYYSVVNHRHSCTEREILSIWRALIASRDEELRTFKQISLPPLVFSPDDFTVVPFYAAKPNYITAHRVTAPLVVAPSPADDLDGKIVAIEKADPGFDWLFAKPIVGLITKYGGANSHMAIRSAEFGMPAAIGCGTLIFTEVIQAHSVTLDCERKTITSHAKGSWSDQHQQEAPQSA